MKHVWHSPQEDTMSSQRMNNIEVLSERLGSLKITNEVSKEIYKQLDEEMSVAPASTNENV